LNRREMVAEFGIPLGSGSSERRIASRKASVRLSA
jgi:hypothetical protein